MNSPSVDLRSTAVQGSRLQTLSRNYRPYVVFGLLYAVCAALAIVVRVPGTQITALWLPGGLLLGALVGLRRRLWPGLLLAAFVAQACAVVALQANGLLIALLLQPLYFVGAMLAARLVDRWGGMPRLATLRSMLVFLFPAVLLVSVSFVGPVVALGWSLGAFQSPLHSFLRILPTVALGTMLLAPLVAAATSARRRRRLPSSATLREGFLIGVALLVIVAWAMRSSLPVTSAATLYAPLPFVLWGAVRAGVAGAALALLLTAVVCIVSAWQGFGPFALGSPEVNVLALHLYLLAASVPILLLAALKEERNATIARLRDSEQQLRERAALARGLAGRVISAREQERATIARDLHDDVGQRVASMAIELSALRRRAEREGFEAHRLIGDLQAAASALATEIGRLSYQLHPAMLTRTGLVPALESLCDEASRRAAVAVRFRCDRKTYALPDDVALCLYRVAQESLRNSLRHGDPTAIHLSLESPGQRLVLQASDDGRGFDARSASTSGLGLLSIDERVRLVGGTVTVTSAPGAGTVVRVEVPCRENA